MEQIKRLYITGYRQYELGVFAEKDPRIGIIKQVLRTALLSYLDQGLEWVIVSGNQGTEQWAGEEVLVLKESFPKLQLALIFPYAEFGSKWQEKSQLALADLMTKADYVDSTSHAAYQSPGQLKAHTNFMLQHTDGALLLFDEELDGKTKFFWQTARTYAEQHEYLLQTISFADLQNAAEDF